jgi:hypothetical protein
VDGAQSPILGEQQENAPVAGGAFDQEGAMLKTLQHVNGTRFRDGLVTTVSRSRVANFLVMLLRRARRGFGPSLSTEAAA